MTLSNGEGVTDGWVYSALDVSRSSRRPGLNVAERRWEPGRSPQFEYSLSPLKHMLEFAIVIKQRGKEKPAGEGHGCGNPQVSSFYRGRRSPFPAQFFL